MIRVALITLLAISQALTCQEITATARPELLQVALLPSMGQVLEIGLPVDACDTLRVVTSFPSDAMQIRFILPDGSGLPWAENDPRIAFDKEAVEVDGKSSFVYQAFVSNPVVGKWKLVIQWPEPQWAGAGTLVYAYFGGSKIEMNTLVPSRAFPLGKPVSATLALMENRKLRLNADIQAALYRDGALVGPVTFAVQNFPELNAKSLIADLNVNEPGKYVLRVEVSGQGATGPFKRSAATDFEVFVSKGKITGDFTSEVK